MKKLKRKSVSVFVTFVLLLSVLTLPVTASSDGKVKFLDKGYTVGEDQASDWVELIDIDGKVVIIKVTVYSDNSAEMTLEKEGEITRYAINDIDFDKYIYDLSHPQQRLIHGVVPYGSEITGSQYVHVRIGSGTQTLGSGVLVSIGVGGIGSALSYLAGLGLPGAIMSGIASSVVGYAGSKVDKLVVTTVTYEVRRTDGSYYTHCYHVQYLSYDAGGHVIGAANDYYQSYGG